MAIAHVVNEIAMTGYAITSGCKRRLMVGARGGMAHRAISLQDEGVTMAAQACVDTAWIRIGNHGTRRNGLAVQIMVAVRNAAVVTNPAVGLVHVANRDVKHTDVLVGRWGGDICPARTGKEQRHAGDSSGY
jgi:hypothetical protein